MMAGNLPPGVNVSNSDAPWNQSHPEPEDFCPQCGQGHMEADTEFVKCDRWLYVELFTCPHCGDVMQAVGRDELPLFLEWVRDNPEMYREVMDNHEETVVELAEAVRRL